LFSFKWTDGRRSIVAEALGGQKMVSSYSRITKPFQFYCTATLLDVACALLSHGFAVRGEDSCPLVDALHGSRRARFPSSFSEDF
jgi:hypothetical protein